MDFQSYNWSSTTMMMSDQEALIDDLFFGGKPHQPPSGGGGGDQTRRVGTEGRTRRVTITEVADDGSTAAAEEEEAGLVSADGIFRLLEDVVRDWKIRMECVVGEGLQQLRRSNKEHRLKMKYLPGEASGGKKLVAAKATILEQWKSELSKSIGTVQSKLDKLNCDKMDEVNEMFANKIQEKRVDAANDVKSAGNHSRLKQLIRELDNAYNMDQINNIAPIYSIQNNNKNYVVANCYQFPLRKYFHNILSSSSSSAVAATTTADPLQAIKTKKTAMGRGTNVMNAQKKMLERKLRMRKKEEAPVARYIYRMHSYTTKSGQDRHFLVRKKLPSSIVEVEDIFDEWRRCMEAKRRPRRRRTRKVSHKAKRKEFLNREPEKGALLYSDVLKKNLRFKVGKATDVQVEDIFQDWHRQLDVGTLRKAKEDRMLGPLHDVSVSDCQVRQNGKKSIFATWHHNLMMDDEKRGKSSRHHYHPKKYEVEKIFSNWRHNLHVKPVTMVTQLGKRKEQQQLKMLPENIFREWMHNFHQHQQKPSKSNSARLQQSRDELKTKPKYGNNHRLHKKNKSKLDSW